MLGRLRIGSGKYLTVIVAVFSVAVLAALWIVDPEQSTWVPKCAFKLATGYDCPACGAQRAAHALLHGHIAQALSYNYFLVVGLPYAATAAIASWVPRVRNSTFRRLVLGKTTAWIYVALFFAWWIIRNLHSI